MPERLRHLSLPGGLGTRLAIAIAAVAVAVVAASFLVVYRGTGADLRDRIDGELREQAVEFEDYARQRQLNGAGLETPSGLRTAARRFIATQRYHLSTQLFAIETRDGSQVTNEEQLVEGELVDEGAAAGASAEKADDDAPRLLDAPDGLSDTTTSDGMPVRVLSTPILAPDGSALGTFRVAQSLEPIDEAQSGIRSSMLAVGAIALALSALIGAVLAGLVTRPLRRFAATASEIGHGRMSERIDYRGDDEVGVLAREFDRMLDRLEEGFDRERRFVADASHELRTPLTVLRGRIELLARERDEAERERSIAELLREIEAMNRLVADMLTLARADSGTLLSKTAVPVAELLEDLRRDLPLFGDRDYRVDEPPEGEIPADPARLAQVLRNLARNAVEHTVAGDRIEVSARARDGAIRFAVTDSGPGMRADDLDRIFERFYRTDEGRDRASGGTGLGLAIARAIVDGHGGRIWAESSPGSGTTISFEIPGFRPRVAGARDDR